METEEANKRYESTLEKYKQSMKETRHRQSLRTFCNDMHTNYRGMVKWMARRGMSVKSVWQQVRSGQSETVKPCEAGFIPFSPSVPSLGPGNDLLSGVNLIFTDGTTLSVKECSPSAIVSLMIQLRKEAVRCSR